ncbi:MAG: hypothetical protein GQ569_03670 [Methylococcaceae bacterium]|nr:hypothetical protein [Methylococcaceae bacterium]
MSSYTLSDGLYIYPTPAGAYYAISSTEEDKSRRFLKSLLQQEQTLALTVDNLLKLADSDDEEKTLKLLHHCQKLGWVQGVETAMSSPKGSLENILPDLLKSLSIKGKVLLADDQGFYLASSGFAHEVAEELSALGAEVSTLHMRRSGLLMSNMGLGSHAWAVVNAVGKSQVGFWPVFIGKNRFVITISGTPHLNQPEFVSLAWALSIRYSTMGNN